ncbi:MAG TPA: heavy-metal-associated domain-containing protein [Thiolapillus brandeum]|uniref:Heavy-metal-associated domain-containing protein n=1 Tax=Thiolapillus brandeum TaxID=1076588 RepID=A0A831JR89_9GAMM|nr:heavy-metal-associated domain-containing protein [Thiolapillus brandeum]
MSDYCTDILIHIDETLDDANIHEIERDISMIDGVYSACVHENARHLMLVDYDPEDVAARELLGTVENRGLHAELIGL